MKVLIIFLAIVFQFACVHTLDAKRSSQKQEVKKLYKAPKLKSLKPKPKATDPPFYAMMKFQLLMFHDGYMCSSAIRVTAFGNMKKTKCNLFDKPQDFADVTSLYFSSVRLLIKKHKGKRSITEAVPFPNNNNICMWIVHCVKIPKSGTVKELPKREIRL